VREGCAAAAVLAAAGAGSPGAAAGGDVAWAAALPESTVALITRRVAERLTTLETPPDVSAVFPLLQPPPLADAAPEALVVYADRLADPGNLGTLLRAAAAFGATALVTSPDTTDHLAPKVVRASMGAVFALPIHAGLPLNEVQQALSGAGRAARIHTYGLAAHGGADLRSADLRRPAVLCVGAERAGLSDQTAALADTLLTIPLAGHATVPSAPASASAAAPGGGAAAAVPGEVESLNAGVAGAIALYEFWCRSAGAPPACADAYGGTPSADADACGVPPTGAGSHPRQMKR